MQKRLGFALPVLRTLKIFYVFVLDAVRYARHSNSVSVNSSKSRMVAFLTYQYHVVEKGLSMPNRRWNFGHPKITSLIEDCNKFIDLYGSREPTLRCAVGVLKTYLDEHAINNIIVPDEIRLPINALAERVPAAIPVKQKKMTRDEYFSSVNSPFVDFAKSRSSVRNFDSKEIPGDDLIEAINIARSAPSACNRQATRVYVIKNRDDIDSVLAFQNGNKGFGHLADKAIVLTADISSFRGAQERNFGWMDSGIFAMNLLYALHHKKIGACPLNAGMSPGAERKVKSLCGIPPEEVVTLFIACGAVPDELELANSERKSVDEIVRFV